MFDVCIEIFDIFPSVYIVALEFRAWLLFYSLPVLDGILQDPYFTHYALLVAAMHVFLSDDISQSEFRWAEICIHRFCRNFADLYGKPHIVNVYIFCT